VNKSDKKIICVEFCNGKQHDFNLLKKSNVRFQDETKVLADSGYQGLQKMHSNTQVPKKKLKSRTLTKQDKKENRKLSSDRVLNENVIGMLKRFKIIADRYRNRRKRFGLRFNLIAGIYNYEIDK
jgi:DDE superfamily endonuclease